MKTAKPKLHFFFTHFISNFKTHIQSETICLLAFSANLGMSVKITSRRILKTTFLNMKKQEDKSNI